MESYVPFVEAECPYRCSCGCWRGSTRGDASRCCTSSRVQAYETSLVQQRLRASKSFATCACPESILTAACTLLVAEHLSTPVQAQAHAVMHEGPYRTQWHKAARVPCADATFQLASAVYTAHKVWQCRSEGAERQECMGTYNLIQRVPHCTTAVTPSLRLSCRAGMCGVWLSAEAPTWRQLNLACGAAAQQICRAADLV
jgi:hypothetical protein